MNDSKSSIKSLLNIIVGLLILIVVVQVAGVLFNLVARLAAFILTVIFVVAVCYLVFLLIKRALQ